MDDTPKLSYTSALLLQTIRSGYSYGFDIMDVTGLPSGTVYPALRRLQQLELIKSNWEGERTAFAEQRPPRKYYRLTREGKETLAKALERESIDLLVNNAGVGESAYRFGDTDYAAWAHALDVNAMALPSGRG